MHVEKKVAGRRGWHGCNRLRNTLKAQAARSFRFAGALVRPCRSANRCNAAEPPLCARMLYSRGRPACCALASVKWKSGLAYAPCSKQCQH